MPLRTPRRRLIIGSSVALTAALSAWDLATTSVIPVLVFIVAALLAGLAFMRRFRHGQHVVPNVSGLLREGLVLGTIGFGGGLATLSLIERRLVRERQWIRERVFLEASALGQSLPGAVAANALCFIGYRLEGLPGAMAAVVGFIAPSFLMLLLFAAVYPYLRDLSAVSGLFRGLNPAVAALVATMALRLGGQAVLGPDGRPGGWKLLVRDRWSLAVVIGAAVGASVFRLGVVEVILTAGMLGVARAFSPILGREIVEVGERWTWLRWRTRRFARDVAMAPGAWWRRLRGRGDDLLAIAPFIAGPGTSYAGALGARFQALGELSGVFLRAGALTFGGGFVMIPLLEAELVHARQWLSSQAFADAMALGQVTPGPVVISATFVGYRIVGLTGALLATASVFLPAFLLVVAFGASVDRFRSHRGVQAFLDGIQPAVVGLMFAAAALLARHGVTDPIGASIAIASFMVLVGLNLAPVWVLAGAGVLGLIATMTGA